GERAEEPAGPVTCLYSVGRRGRVGVAGEDHRLVTALLERAGQARQDGLVTEVPEAVVAAEQDPHRRTLASCGQGLVPGASGAGSTAPATLRWLVRSDDPPSAEASHRSSQRVSRRASSSSTSPTTTPISSAAKVRSSEIASGVW